VREEAGRRLVPGLAIAAYLLAHFLLRPLLVARPLAPDLLAGALLLAALHLRPGATAGVGFVAGVLEGAMALEGMGVLGAAFAVVGYLAARARELFFADSALFLPAFAFVGVWTLHVTELLAVGASLDWVDWLLRAPVSAGLTAVLLVLTERAVTAGPGTP
jgi:cell shape-determining protein MreD